MEDYEPLDLLIHANVGIEFVSSDMPLALGYQQFHGLPFLIGGQHPDPTRCLLGFAGKEGACMPVSIPIGHTAHTLIIAHRLLESQIPVGEAVGRMIATYRVAYSDGTHESLPIRERFEIATIPTAWGQWPFLAHADQQNGLMPRVAGQWAAMGARQVETVHGQAASYYLWAWTNPRPQVPLVAIQIEPGDRAFIIAALTLGHRDEAPFPRIARRMVTVTLPDSQDAQQPFNLDVHVDRGVATYPYPLSQMDLPAFLADPLAGWGELPNEQSSPAYVAITATPSATVSVVSGGATMGATTWGALEHAGQISTARVQLMLADPGQNWVRVTVVDDTTGQPLPCRIHFRSPAGIPYQPHGHHAHVNSNMDSWHGDIGGDLRLGQITYAYINGHCEGWLPRGEVVVDVARGFEYQPLRTVVTIAPGQQQLTLRLHRWIDMNAHGWYSGDSHVHFLGTSGAHYEAQGEDLNIVNLLQSQWGHLFTNAEDALGATISNGGRTIVYTSQENRQHMLGHLTLWGLQRPVMPWCTDGPSEAELGGALETTLSAWADAAHAQGGTVIIPHLPTPNCEPAVLIATGRADGIEMLRDGEYEHLEYYRYLNGGYRLPLVGGTDKMSSDVPVGLYRTYAALQEGTPFTYDSWCQAVRAGRTFLSGGPMIHFSVEGTHIGDILHIARGGLLEVEAWAESIFPIHRLEIVQQGRVVAASEESHGARRITLRTKVRIDSHTWLAARCGGPVVQPLRHHDVWQRGIFAHTSPIYVAVNGDWHLFDPTTAEYMLTLIAGGLDYMRHQALQYRPGTVTHHHGEDDHLAYLERPFREAQAILHRRLHDHRIPH